MKTSSASFIQANPGDLVTPFEDHSVIVFVISEDRDDDAIEIAVCVFDAVAALRRSVHCVYEFSTTK
jgi:hypothetical protein